MYELTIILKNGKTQTVILGDTKEYLLGMICKLYKEDILEMITKISLKRINKSLYN
jgi:hypothetical protein